MRTIWDVATDIGTRKENEDAYGFRHGTTTAGDGDHAVAVVCDGLGGHVAGAIAAECARNGFLTSYERNRHGETIAERLRRAINAGNDAVRKRGSGDRELAGMGTTLVAAVMTDDGIEWISAGDSAMSLWEAKSGKLKALNPRHNLPGQPNQLTSALMGTPIPMISASTDPCPAAVGDIVILASDGLDTLPAERLATTVAESATNEQESLADKLVQATLATNRPRQDNVTVVTGRVQEPTPEPHRGQVSGRRYPGDVEVSVDGEPLDWRASLAVQNHSPCGPEWGYRGSGPAQLALAVLVTLIGKKRAVPLYQRFKEEFLAGIKTDRWEIGIDQIRSWAQAQESAANAG